MEETFTVPVAGVHHFTVPVAGVSPPPCSLNADPNATVLDIWFLYGDY